MTRISVAVVDGQRTFAHALAARLTAEPDLLVVAVSESVAAARRLLDDRDTTIKEVAASFGVDGATIYRALGLGAAMRPAA